MRRGTYAALVPAMIAATLGVWLLHPLATADRELAFRDGASYYAPQYEFLRSRWLHGTFPLWSPIENAGSNLAADATFGTFYPPKVVFLLPVPWPLPYHLYIVFHLLLAYVGMYGGLTRQGRSATAATLAAVSYACCGHVFSQIHNVPYLVSAAWLPWAWFAAGRVMTHRSSRAWSQLALSFAAIILGGDPHTAVNLLLVWLVFSRLRLWSPGLRTGSGGTWQKRLMGASPGSRRLVSGIAVGICLAAPQILPAALEVAHSSRAYFDQPRSVWEGLSATLRGRLHWTDAAAATWRPATPGSHAAAMDDFSVAPWRWMEVWWPNIGGRFFPRYSRWFDAIPAEGRSWSLSLYAGLVPFLLATLAARFSAGSLQRRQATWLVAFAAAASLGSYSIGWMINECHFATSGDPHELVNSSFGGVYWLLAQVVPGYALYRYPAKWWTFVSLGSSILCAYGADHFRLLRKPLLRRAAMLSALSVLGIAIVLTCRPQLLKLLATTSGDPFFAPLSPQLAVRDVLLALTHGTAISVLAIAVARGQRAPGCLLLLVTAADLAVANRWLVPTVPISTRAVPAPVLPPAGRLYRSPHRTDLVEPGPEQDMMDRLKRQLDQDRATLYNKHAYSLFAVQSYQSFAAWHHRLVGVIGTESPLMPVEIEILNRHTLRGEMPQVVGPLRYLYVTAVYPDDMHLSVLLRDMVLAHPKSLADWHRIDSSTSVIRAVDLATVVALPYTNGPDRASFQQWLEQQWSGATWYVDAESKDWRQACKLAESSANQMPRPSAPRVDRCRFRFDTGSNAVIVQLELSEPRLIVLPLRYSHGWRVRYAPSHRDREERLAAYRVQGMLTGVCVPRGTSVLRLEFRPPGLKLGVVLSLCGAAALLGGAWYLRRSRT